MSSVNQLLGATVQASDGKIGHVVDAFFDDHAWAIRFLVVDTGSFLAGRQVLISPYAVRTPWAADAKHIDVALTCEQVKHSPSVATHEPLSRRHEREQLSYYGYPAYWGLDNLWAMSAVPVVPPPPDPSELQAQARRERDVSDEDRHLRSADSIKGYDIHASDERIGHVDDFLFDTNSWAIHALVIDTRNWWPGGKKVRLDRRLVQRIDWEAQTVYVQPSCDQIRNGPAYEKDTALVAAGAEPGRGFGFWED